MAAWCIVNTMDQAA